ncbi:hypothetical protein [Gloeocapsopsis dulcis]|uniref:Uncharacterized protein n=1 Tax=Gloeocapsopsis dulcis AAB1 = 1H9 TaxID=1433147 RepID=A0A6N8FW54_9CHRO|nr:hypothetical protein [Gloeocapsopsis dulcis]MUL37181.1 hypothetical protein [Gloeocapsopsis dulcis AAB1 = 1H9]WNN90212.1 hypothetical protein P0S91_03680 [Gloeocapsopsis dulcis]
MNTNPQEVNQKIRDNMTQLQIDLEKTFKKIFEQAGSKIKPEKQDEIQKAIDSTKLLLERFKCRYELSCQTEEIVY